MIRVKKPRKIPLILKGKGVRERRRLCKLYNASKEEYRAGTKRFNKEFDRAIYAHKTVKSALLAAQHGKCCFCESKVTHNSPGDVDHFRPKAGFRQAADDPLGRPGYYWLAYEWSNLLFCCSHCNQRHERNLFPLFNPESRATSHRDDIREEQPMLLNPAMTDPAEYLGFRDRYVYAIDGNPIGRETIEALGLNRAELAESRFKIFKLVNKILQFQSLISRELARQPSPALLEEFRANETLLEELIHDSSEYAAMIRSALATFGLI